MCAAESLETMFKILKLYIFWEIICTLEKIAHQKQCSFFRLRIKTALVVGMFKVNVVDFKASLTGILLPDYAKKGENLNIRRIVDSRKWDFARRFYGIFHSHLTTVTVLPATPVFSNTVPQTPDLGCVFPRMRFEDLRLSSFFSASTIPVGQPVPSLVLSGYYHDVIFEDTRCFCCGRSFGQGHSQDCEGKRAQCNIPLNLCLLHHQHQVEQNLDLHMIVNSRGFSLRDGNVRRGSVRERSRAGFRLPPVVCPTCENNPANDVVYSCRHRERTCETCRPLQDFCPFCGQGTAYNLMMHQYYRRTSIREGNPCLLCVSRPAIVLLQPCRHLVLCAPCSRGIGTCPRCHADIEETVETLL